MPFGEFSQGGPVNPTSFLFEGAGPAAGLSLFTSGCPRNLATIGPLPNDGNLHTVIVAATLKVTSLETGGQVLAQWTAGGVTVQQAIFTGGQGVGSAPFNPSVYCVDPNSTFAIVQNTNLTGGAAKLYVALFQF